MWTERDSAGVTGCAHVTRNARPPCHKDRRETLRLYGQETLPGGPPWPFAIPMSRMSHTYPCPTGSSWPTRFARVRLADTLLCPDNPIGPTHRGTIGHAEAKTVRDAALTAAGTACSAGADATAELRPMAPAQDAGDAVSCMQNYHKTSLSTSSAISLTSGLFGTSSQSAVK